MLCTIRQILSSINYSVDHTRTLGELELDRDAEGRPRYSVGNSAVLFKIRHKSEWWAMKCYMHSMPNLDIIYGENYLPRELYVYIDDVRGDWVDVVIYRWVEGRSLGCDLHQALEVKDNDRLELLSNNFDKLALSLLESDSAHGDITLDNIIVNDSGDLTLIDFDGSFMPQMEGQMSSEVGTAAFQHPQRAQAPFDRNIDDYSLALISSALNILKIDPNFERENLFIDGLIFDPKKIVGGRSEALQRALALFAKEGKAVEYRIAELMLSINPRLNLLKEFMRFKIMGCDAAHKPSESFVEGNMWGFYDERGRKVIPPIFSEAFDFREGFAAVRIDRYWHFIDERGDLAINCSRYDYVKSFRNGSALAFEGEGWHTLQSPKRVSSR